MSFPSSQLRVSRLSALAVAALVLLGCSSTATDGGSDAGAGGSDATVETATTTTTTTTTTIPDRPPELRMSPSARAEIGQTWTDAIIATDPDGDLATVQIEDAPRGFFPLTNSRGLITGFEWEPTDPGQWMATVIATDATGLVKREELLLIARQPRDVDLLMAMGDSVAAGFGRDRSDYFTSDECWRGESIAYPTLVLEQLVDAGALAGGADLSLVACSGHLASDLLQNAVVPTDADGDVIDSTLRTQLEWAVEQNPTIVTITVGAADIHLLDPTPLLVSGANQDPDLALDQELLAQRLQAFDDSLDELLGTLVTTTDAHIALTTWFNPTAIDPVGSDDCSDACFRTVAQTMIDALNDRIASVARRHPSARLTLVRLDDLAVGRGAPNGLGPDVLRENGLGPLQGLADRFTGGRSPWCADDDGPDDTIISRLDCVHPNEDGQQAIADRVAQALLDL